MFFDDCANILSPNCAGILRINGVEMRADTSSVSLKKVKERKARSYGTIKPNSDFF
jgi:hypothetical protein